MWLHMMQILVLEESVLSSILRIKMMFFDYYTKILDTRRNLTQVLLKERPCKEESKNT